MVLNFHELFWHDFSNLYCIQMIGYKSNTESLLFLDAQFWHVYWQMIDQQISWHKLSNWLFFIFLTFYYRPNQFETVEAIFWQNLDCKFAIVAKVKFYKLFL